MSPGDQVDAAVTGQAQISDPRLRNIKRELRQCTIQGEIKLKHFETYTSPYCLLECLTEALLSQCHCVPYYYPGKNLLIDLCGSIVMSIIFSIHFHTIV